VRRSAMAAGPVVYSLPLSASPGHAQDLSERKPHGRILISKSAFARFDYDAEGDVRARGLFLCAGPEPAQWHSVATTRAAASLADATAEAEPPRPHAAAAQAAPAPAPAEDTAKLKRDLESRENELMTVTMEMRRMQENMKMLEARASAAPQPDFAAPIEGDGAPSGPAAMFARG
ncbi:unnamed protein product, partial [Prorocentrum cordatum]